MMFAQRVGRWQLILTQFVEGVQTEQLAYDELQHPKDVDHMSLEGQT